MYDLNAVAPLGEITVRGETTHIYPPTARDLRSLLVLRDLATAAATSGDLFASLQPAHIDALCDLVDELAPPALPALRRVGPGQQLVSPDNARELPLDRLVTAAAELLEHVPALWAPYIAGTLTPALQRLSTLASQFAAASAAGTAPEA